MIRCLLPKFSVAALFATLQPAVAAADCAMLINAATGAVLERSGDCETPVTPASTFKVPLAAMGFDSGVLVDADQPVWAFEPGFADWMEDWKTEVSPRYWLEKSVVWYSQELTKKLGMAAFQNYVDQFDYGNRDLAGDPGKENGLTNAWLRSSLRISPIEQAQFLDRLVNRRLGLSAAAYDHTEAAMPQVQLANGWTVSGKTGTSFRTEADGAQDKQRRQLGWFVGWAEKDARKVIFVKLIVDETKQEGFAGPRARSAMLEALPEKLDRF
jgi:beta-lactamase class D